METKIPSDYSESGERDVVRITLNMDGATRDFVYGMSDAPNSKLTRLIDRVQQLGNFVFLEDIVKYYSEWENVSYTMNIRGETVDTNVWLPTVLRPATEEEKEKYKGEIKQVTFTSEDKVTNYIRDMLTRQGTLSVDVVKQATGADIDTIISAVVTNLSGVVIRDGVIYKDTE